MDGLGDIKMPRGIFLLIHDDIKGPEVKASYYTMPIDLSQEFISKLYMSHASFEATSTIEMKFSHYKIVSCFTGHIARKAKKEGILGLVFEENEKVDNIELFLKRNLDFAITNKDDKTLIEIFTKKLFNYLELNQIFNKVEIEKIPEIFIVYGDKKNKFKSFVLKIGEKIMTNLEMTHIYQKISQNNQLLNYKHVKLNVKDGDNNYYLIFKVSKPDDNIDKILITIKPYLENYFSYSLEILALFFLPHIIKIISMKGDWKKQAIYEGKSKSILESLEKKGKNYGDEFNKLILSLISGELFVGSNLKEK